jgi:hypothetical protein
MLSKFNGLKNKVTPERLKEGDLAVAVNIDIDDEGQIKRRRGYTKLHSGGWHSIYSYMDKALAVKDEQLVVLSDDGSYSVLHPAPGPDKVSYETVSDKVYYSCRYHNGVVDFSSEPIREEWVSPIEGWHSPIQTVSSTQGAVDARLLASPFHASHIAYFNSRIYMSVDNVLWATEMYAYSTLDKTKNFKQFESTITCLASVTDGLYVGTTSGLYFLSGPFDTMKRVKVFDYPVIPYSVVRDVDPSLIDAKFQSRSCVLLMSSMGLHVCLDDGTEVNLSKDHYIFPKVDSASAFVRSQDGVNQLVLSTHGSGSPASTARFGDFVDAEIRRFNGGSYAAS